ncbi:hypothetical protein CcaverHIS002_0301120 [Cutaneotrichosporon cavernicola]|uniref:Protein-lysine N-methyltransferase EFM5 n=1 Tax=Cutaneotrichosporon cavernicola TaxID=279322 RepID=A0AA48L2Q6_9TREE|nr:uncharacterized protein CcaverHIS019_0301080 [Cutaneotrichosporon cavernicola]BEI82244.1 hypothetical protein CcaverHIS002_0301120 [Cutaneotrichosporon cavernicola]BEI90038.1 hypothetical protein CcaverHIS019_0301080 [Cutaneotrichosporon cavernicola]BEI97812.1 hypothetical protein CcaverHIS631_0301110 [Cutaneotrichosporon cavernicola]BEJ05590.1 hypothetical protein CcaverHIS641_0301120 [Cutaneotrichosporon cavernicola]
MLATASHPVPLGSSPEVGLSSAAVSALAQFMADSQALEEMAAAYTAADNLSADKEWSMDAFPELWGMSQFWNDENTARKLARECVSQAKGGTIVLISSPSVFLMLKKMGVPNKLLLLEYDSRFSVFPEFRFYDFARPLSLGGMKEQAAVVLVDPPYVNAECFSKAAQTTRALSGPDTKIIACTGWVVRHCAAETLGVKMINFRPGHAGGLATPFRAYVNYESKNPSFMYDPDPEDGDNDGTAFAGAGGIGTDA